MGVCYTCQNDYQDTFTIIKDDMSYDFDSFECAIQALAPRCASCGCAVIGHGVDFGGEVYCGNNCLRKHKKAEVTYEESRYMGY